MGASEAGKPAAAVWHFRTPYIVTDASVKLKIARRSAADVIRLHLSTDGGKSWAPLWQCPDDQLGKREISVPICKTFRVTDRTDPPADLASPFGRYSFRLKLELIAGRRGEDCRVEDIAFETVVQQNLFALPQLQPGRNRITVRGGLAKGAAVKVTYVWDDPVGSGRKNVTIVENAPHTYEIIAAGQKWSDSVCKSITVEAVRATGEGNRTLVKEAASKIHPRSPLPPAEDTTGRWLGQQGKDDLPPLAKLLAATTDPRRFRSVLGAAVIRADPRMFDAFREVAYKTAKVNQKHQAFIGLYRSDPTRARAVLLDIVRDPAGKRVAWSPGKDKEDKGWGRTQSWCCGSTVIGYIAAEAGWKEFLPELLKVLADPQCSHHWGPRYGTIRVIGLLGHGDEAAAKAILGVLTDATRKEHGDAKAVAAEAAGRIRHPMLIPALRRYVSNSYLPLCTGAAISLGQLGDKSIVATMRTWLKRTDEGHRGAAAEALGDLKDARSVVALKAALAVEPFAWVRENIRQALAKIATARSPAGT
ncbi:hypothetical protein LCGC14_2215100 [marine sediment metagenome]|uniref:Uncharacterized protein n=1 Tax=marine sediment metagenome TaxID=412755 RepID=A0A0F9DCK1_9ZZZZ